MGILKRSLGHLERLRQVSEPALGLHLGWDLAEMKQRGWIERELQTGERLDPCLRFLPAVGRQERPVEILPARKTRPRLR